MMSIGDVEKIHARLREELQRCGLSLAEAARLSGEKDAQRLRDVAAGRQKCPIDLLARLVELGIDGAYVIAGHPRELRDKLGEVRRATDVVFEAMRQELGVSQDILAELQKQIIERGLSASEGSHLLHSALLREQAAQTEREEPSEPGAVYPVNDKEIELLRNYRECTEEGKFAIEKASLGIHDVLSKELVAQRKKRARKGGA